MNDKRLYAEILGIVSPWEVKDVQIDLGTSQVEIIIDYIKGTAPCVVCSGDYGIHDSNHGYTWQKFEYRFAFEVLDSAGWLISDDIDASPTFGEIAEHSGIHSFGLVDKRKLIGVARRTFT